MNFKFKSLITLLAFAFFNSGLISCDDSGMTSKKLNGDEQSLPEELKGLKVYNVSTGGGAYVNVAILEGKVNSTTYQVGKITETTIILDSKSGRAIQVNNILIENDSLIVCRK